MCSSFTSTTTGVPQLLEHELLQRIIHIEDPLHLNNTHTLHIKTRLHEAQSESQTRDSPTEPMLLRSETQYCYSSTAGLVLMSCWSISECHCCCVRGWFTCIFGTKPFLIRQQFLWILSRY